jgi:hypothetical protein
VEGEMGEKRNAYRLLVGKPEGKRPLGRPRCRWVDNIMVDLGEVGWGGVDVIGLARVRDRWIALVIAGKLSRGFATGGLSSSAQLHGVSFWHLSCLTDISNRLGCGKLASSFHIAIKRTVVKISFQFFLSQKVHI